jgi:hypothetical protein
MKQNWTDPLSLIVRSTLDRTSSSAVGAFRAPGFSIIFFGDLAKD